jgi:beta-galactosidase
MDGKPYQIISGEMHYPRVPRAYWRDRFRKARAMGLNTITTYVFWNVHEPQPGLYDFAGQNDVAEYIREAQQEGLNVILRPGPFVCAEWELGGYPSWLLKDRNLILRSREPLYTAAVHRWLVRLGQEIHPLLLQNGGPIIAIQLENEYGYFGNDKAYLAGLKAELTADGFGGPVFYTADGPRSVPRGSLFGLPAAINFGTGTAHKSFADLAEVHPDGPRMAGEFWTGWFDHWGEKHHTTSSETEAGELEWMLGQGFSVNIYMFHGGTSFGWMNGANLTDKKYEPETTSYDYDAPLDERGEPRDKFYLFRKVIAEATGINPPPAPPASKCKSFPMDSQLLSSSLWNNLPAPVHSKTLLTMEDLNQSYGYVLYRTQLQGGQGGSLVVEGLHDYAQIYIDQKLIGTLDRRLATDTVDLSSADKPRTLDILVENGGRVNISKAILTERKGITGAVTIGGSVPQSWTIYSLPMNNLSAVKFAQTACAGPCFFRTKLKVDTPADTYIDTRGLHKGMLWLGDKALGRFWSIGPQYTLYTPGPWLKPGENAVTFFDVAASKQERISSSTEPIFNTLDIAEDGAPELDHGPARMFPKAILANATRVNQANAAAHAPTRRQHGRCQPSVNLRSGPDHDIADGLEHLEGAHQVGDGEGRDGRRRHHKLYRHA